MQSVDQEDVNKSKEEVAQEIKSILDHLEGDYPGATEGVATAVGAAAGAGGSLAALYAFGTTGLSAAGITSGLATAGAIVGGGMVAGIGVLAAPVAVLGVVGYAIAKKRKNAKLAAALGTALSKLYNIQEQLLKNAEFYKEEIAEIKAVIDTLNRKQAA